MVNLIVCCLLILCGAFILLICIFRSDTFRSFIPYITSSAKKPVEKLLTLHRILIILFFFGYLAVAVLFIIKYSIINNLFVSIIFFFGAIFVNLSIMIYTKLLNELQITLRGLMPICAWCKKILDNKSKNQSDWKSLDAFIKQKTHLEFTHTICPDCYKKKYGDNA